MRIFTFACWILFAGWMSSPGLAADPPRSRLQVINGSDQPIDVFWIESEEKRVASGSVAPGAETFITTTLKHRFAFVSQTDKSESFVTSDVPIQAYRVGGVPKFYTQSVSAHGYPIVASAQVNLYALQEAAFLVDQMLAKRPDVREAMIKSGSRLCIMAYNEFTTDLPEFARLAQHKPREAGKVTAKEYWDRRARGLGGSETDPYCSCAEENLLCYQGDPYSAENILIHEFAHNIHLRGLVNVDPTFDARLKQAYQRAKAAGLWKGKYASTNHHEYFAEGVQSWFDNNRENDHDHNHVNTRTELIEYDPDLATICREVFGDTELKYTKPETRLSGHLAGYDPAQAPTFRWPDRLTQAGAEIKRRAKERDEAANGAPAYEDREIAGWNLKISRELFKTDGEATEQALKLLEKQLDEIVRNVPGPALAELRKVPLYFSPEYKGVPPCAEYHPGADWLKEHGRDPAMVKGVEFTNVRIFEAEVNRMPNFALHELAHAYHDRVLAMGFGNQEIAAAFARAKDAGIYERVERHLGNGKPNTFERAYAMTNAMEYFAECTEAYFSRNDFFPFTRDELKSHDPEMFALLEKLWGAR
jgi:hypothetical protein